MLDLPELFGKYVLLDRIAIGGMAEIFKAKAAGLGGFEKLLAIKRLHPRYSEDEDFIRMLVDEAKIAVQLNHMNICQIFDLGRHDDLVYIAMELIEGRDLYRLLKRLAEQGRMMPVEASAFVAMEMLSALDYAHRKIDKDGVPLDIVHRDISPQNILLSWEGEVKLVDFGIAKATSRAFETQSGIIKGKFYYMSPEQARGDKIDQRSDIFSAAIVLYEMLTGVLMYGEENDVTLLSRVRRADIAPPTKFRPEVPPDLERIVMKGLRRDVRRRYQNAHQFQMALAAWLYASGHPFGRMHLAQMMREEFGQEQVHPAVDFSIDMPDRFLSRVEFTGHGEAVQSETLLNDVDDETMRFEGRPADMATHATPRRPSMLDNPGAPRQYDPYAEGILLDDHEFEGGPTDFAGEGEGFLEPDEPTGIYRGHLRSDDLADTGANPHLSPDSSPPLPPPPVRGAAPPPEPNAPSAAPPPRRRELASDNFTSDIITGVYNEPTKVNYIGDIDARMRQAEESESFEVPGSMKLLFAIGLVLILMMGGTISALGGVLVDSATPSPPTAFATTPDADPGTAVGVVAPAPDAAAPVAAATTTLAVEVEGLTDAVAAIEGVGSRTAPTTFEALEVGRSYTLQLEALGYDKLTEAFVLPNADPARRTFKLVPSERSVIVTSTPSRARILVDGEDSGLTTPTTALKLALNVDHTIKLELDGHESVEVAFKRGNSDEEPLEVNLPAAAKEPAPVAEVKVAARTPTPQPQPRRDVVNNNNNNNRDRERERERERRERERRERERRDAPRDARGGSRNGASNSNDVGYISVTSRPWGQVLIDNKLVKKETPLDRKPVSVGDHTVTVVFPSLAGHRKTKRVRVAKGATVPIFFSP